VSDTLPDVAAAFRALMMQRTESERAMMAFEMFDLARVLVTAGVRANHPGITDQDLRVQLFERTYGNDFDDAERSRIVMRIRDAAVRRV
jgi:hypothetical protein